MILGCITQGDFGLVSLIVSVVSVAVSIISLYVSHQMARVEHKIALSSRRIIARAVILSIGKSLLKAIETASKEGDPSLKDVADDWCGILCKDRALTQLMKGVANMTSPYDWFSSSWCWLENELHQVEFLFEDKSIGKVANALAELLKECADEYSRFNRNMLAETKFDPKAENVEIVVSNIASVEEKLDKEMRLY